MFAVIVATNDGYRTLTCGHKLRLARHNNGQSESFEVHILPGKYRQVIKYFCTEADFYSIVRFSRPRFLGSDIFVNWLQILDEHQSLFRSVRESVQVSERVKSLLKTPCGQFLFSLKTKKVRNHRSNT
jgi:hypothetical protein